MSTTTAAKEKLIIAIDTEFEHESVITGNCLQLAFVAFQENLEDIDNKDTWVVDSLSVCFEDQGLEKDPKIMEFWAAFPEIRARIGHEAKPIHEQMAKVQTWLTRLSATYEITFMADIANVDFAWLKNLYLRYCMNPSSTSSPYSMPYKCLCLNGMEEALMILGFTKKQMKEYCRHPNFRHTHYALDDAFETAHYYLGLKKLLLSLSS